MANDKGARAPRPNILVKIKLDRQYLWSGKFYGPGEVQVPDSMVKAYNLTPIVPPKSKSKPDLNSEA